MISSFLLESEESMIDSLMDWAPSIIAFIVVIGIANIVKATFSKKLGPALARRHMSTQVTTALVGIFGMIIVIALIPLDPSNHKDLVTVIGIVVTGVLGLSSATFVGNAMAGLMLRMVGNFKPGDFLTVGENFGRVTVCGLLHTEIQTPSRDLTTLPNMYLVVNPVTVARSSGTIVSCEVSLGYDVPRMKAKDAMIRAAEETGLEDAFVQVLALGDFSVTYRINGLLKEVKVLVSVRSMLHEAVLDKLHAAKIEIVSPNFMNQRIHAPDSTFVPPRFREDRKHSTRIESLEDLPDAKIFDKAEEAGGKEELLHALKRVEGILHDLKAKPSGKGKETEKHMEETLKRVEAFEGHKERLEEKIEAIDEELKKKD